MFLLVSFTDCEIHRARNKPKGPSRSFEVEDSSPRPVWPPGPEDSFNIPKQEYNQNENERDSIHTQSGYKIVWMYSLISATLVGLSGIFPLLVIPLDAGDSLKIGGNILLLMIHSDFVVTAPVGLTFFNIYTSTCNERAWLWGTVVKCFESTTQIFLFS